jgi:hypothetical protein
MTRIWRGLRFHGHNDKVDIAIWASKNLENFESSQQET